MGLTLCGLCLASTCALIIADLDPLVKGFSEIFSEFFVPLVSPLGIPFRTCPTYSEPNPDLTGYLFLAGSVPVATFTDLQSHRDLLWWSPRSLRNHPLSMVLLYHTRLGLSRVFQKFLKIFLSSPHYLIFCDGGARAYFSRLPTRFLAMVVNPLRFSGVLPPQGLYFATMASPCSATVGVPRRGWGSHPLLTLL